MLVALLAAAVALVPNYEPRRRWLAIVIVILGILTTGVQYYLVAYTGRGLGERAACAVFSKGSFCALERPVREASPPDWRSRNLGGPNSPMPEPETVSADGYGIVQIGMSISDAYTALGAGAFSREDLSGWSTSDSTCFPIAPMEGRLGLEFLVVSGRIARLDVYSKAIKTEEGIGVGSSEAEVERAYRGHLEISQHKYAQNGRYYRVSPPHTQNAMIFDIIDGKVQQYRAGSPPSVDWVERCL